MDSDQEWECKYGQMGPSMKGSGPMIRQMVKAGSIMPVVIDTKANGKMTWPMDMGYIIIAMEPCTKVSGKTISKMEQAKKNGKMEVSIEESM